MGKLFTNNWLSFIVSIITIQVIAFPIGILILFAALMLGFDPEPGLDIYLLSLVAMIIALPKAHQFLAWGRRNADKFGQLGAIDAEIMGVTFTRFRLATSCAIGFKTSRYAYGIALQRKSAWGKGEPVPGATQFQFLWLVIERCPIIYLL